MSSVAVTSDASKAPTTDMSTPSTTTKNPPPSPYKDSLSPKKQPTIALSAHTAQKHSTPVPIYNPPKNSKPSDGFPLAKKTRTTPFRTQQYNCKYWVTKGYCNTKNTTCKWRHDSERRNAWPWPGEQDEVFPDLVGQYSE